MHLPTLYLYLYNKKQVKKSPQKAWFALHVWRVYKSFTIPVGSLWYRLWSLFKFSISIGFWVVVVRWLLMFSLTSLKFRYFITNPTWACTERPVRWPPPAHASRWCCRPRTSSSSTTTSSSRARRTSLMLRHRRSRRPGVFRPAHHNNGKADRWNHCRTRERTADPIIYNIVYILI